MSKQNVVLIQGIYDAFATGDVAGVLGRMSPTIVWYEAENFPYADRNPYVGPEAVANGVFARCIGEWNGFAVAIDEILDAGDAVVALGRYLGTYKATGKQMRSQIVHVWRVADGKAVAFQQYADTLQTARVIGALEAMAIGASRAGEPPRSPLSHAARLCPMSDMLPAGVVGNRFFFYDIDPWSYTKKAKTMLHRTAHRNTKPAGIFCTWALSLLAAAPAQASTNHYGLTISTAATQNVSFNNGVFTATADHAVLNVSDLENALAGGNIEVTTDNGSGGDEMGDLHVEAAFNWTGANALTLDAYHSIFVDQAVSDAGTGGIALTKNDGGTGGVLLFGSNGNIGIQNLSNALTIDGVAYTLAGDIATLASDVAANPSGSYALANPYNAAKDGTYGSSPIPTTLTGAFNGLGNTIQNLSITQKTKGGAPVGLFEQVDGTVGNIGLIAVNIVTRRTDVGALTATNNGTVNQTWVTGTVGGSEWVGGAVGNNSGVVTNSWSTAAVSATRIGAGGLVGANWGTVDTSYATGTIKAPAKSNVYVGGLVGCSCGGTVSNSHATGDVSDSTFSGGLAGYNIRATIVNSYATGNVEGSYYTGGLVGYNDASDVTSDIEQSFATGAVSGSYLVGGLVGYNQFGDVINSYALGRVQGTSGSAGVGGLIGWNDSYAQYNPVVSSSYSTGLVKGESGDAVGGFMGGDSAPTYTTDCYWDTKTSKTDDGVAGGNEAGITGLTTKQLRSGLPSGFDSGIWAETKKVNGGLPYLIANPPPK